MTSYGIQQLNDNLRHRAMQSTFDSTNDTLRDIKNTLMDIKTSIDALVKVLEKRENNS